MSREMKKSEKWNPRYDAKGREEGKSLASLHTDINNNSFDNYLKYALDISSANINGA